MVKTFFGNWYQEGGISSRGASCISLQLHLLPFKSISVRQADEMVYSTANPFCFELLIKPSVNKSLCNIDLSFWAKRRKSNSISLLDFVEHLKHWLVLCVYKTIYGNSSQ